MSGVGTEDNGPKYSPELRAAVDAMTKQDGLYIVAEGLCACGGAAPLVVIRGKIYSVVIDQELSPERFSVTAQLSGPFLPTPTKK